MMQRLILTATAFMLLAATTGEVEARNFLFNRQVGSDSGAEALPAPPGPSQQRWLAPAQKMPYQATQKAPYQAMQKGAYSKTAVATCVRYVQHRPHRKTCCDCSAPYQTTLTVIDPRTCCPVAVPVCLPSCCVGYPHASGRNGLLGRGITRFSWSCGYTVRVVIGHHGDVTVHYYGV